MNVDASGRLKTEGRRKLCGVAAVSKGKGAELCRKLRISKSFLSDLMSGRHRPGLDLAIRMWRELGIPVHAWSTEGRNP